MRTVNILTCTLVVLGAPSNGQTRPSSVAGAHVGAEAGAVDHHFVLATTGPSGRSDRNVTRWGVGGGVFAGYDVQLAPRVIGGVAAALNFGGRTASTQFAGQRYAIRPRYGFSLTSRVGYLVTHDALLYFRGGYGGHLYRIDTPPGGADFGPWNRSFILGGGGEFRLSGRTALRTEFQHLDGSRNQFMLGLLKRFR